VLGIDPASVDTSVARPNASLSGAEVTFLRQVNEALSSGQGRTLDRGERGRYVKGVLAQQVLAARPGKQRYAPPAERFDEVRRRAEQTVQGLRDGGYPVAGDLAELLPEGPGAARTHPDEVGPAELLAVGADAVSGLVQHAVSLRAAYLPEPGAEPPALRQRLRRRLEQRLEKRLRPIARRVRDKLVRSRS
jgi:hypothetical protein